MSNFDGLVTGGVDNLVRLWDINTGCCINTLEGHTEHVTGIAQISSTTFGTVSRDKTIRIWNTNGDLVQVLVGHKEYVDCITTINNDTIATGSRDDTACVWSLYSGECTAMFKQRFDINTILYHQEAHLLYTGSDDRVIRGYDLETKERIQELKGHSFSISALEELGHYREHCRLASASVDRTIRIWDLTLATSLREIKTPHKEKISQLLKIGNNLIASCGDHNIHIHDVDTGALIKTLSGHTDKINSMCVIDHDIIASACSDGTVRTWSISTGLCLLASDPKPEHSINCILRMKQSGPASSQLMVRRRSFVYQNSPNRFSSPKKDKCSLM
ncbi:hypothetical protein AKO1_013897 [Acrasis kona]|uniref:Uncharacterized protein n=1 Tax=Acrasis kona TaxID=1008807 RepID=A0AAW2ZGD5_9EUKA